MKIAVNGKNLYFDIDGEALPMGESGLVDKPTLILLHGAPGNSDHTVFKPIFSELSDSAQVIYLDMAGCGRSDNPADGIFSLESWADDLAEFCALLHINKPIILGNSGGGMVAAMFGIRHPHLPGKLILSSTQARLNTDRCLDKFEQLGGPEVRAVAEKALVTHGDLESFIEYSKKCMTLYNTTPQTRVRQTIFRRECADAFHKLDGIWHQMDFLDQLPMITCPTMIMTGDADPVTPIEDSEDMAEKINPRFLRFEKFTNAGHGVWLDNHDDAFAVIRDFISN